jgi:HAD superfamily hydrolase (TIGR01490 family)
MPSPTAGRPQLVLFDLDHTLLEGDSDVLWCEYLMQQGLLDRASFAPRNEAMERAYLAGTVSVQAFSSFYVSTLAGRSAAEWEPLRRAFLGDVVAPRIGGRARALVAGQRQAGALVVLTTATNRYITELTAGYLGIEHLLATECELDAQGRFTGRPAGTVNMREGKVTRLHAWLAERGERLADYESWAYSDSMNDLPLLGATDHAVVVHADERLARVAAERGWPALRLHGPGADA